MRTAKSSVSESASRTHAIEACGRTNHSGHIVQFYAEDSSFIESLGESVGAELQAGNGVIVIATRAHRDGLAQRLKALGVNAAEPISRGRYLVLDAAETLSKFLLQGRPDAARFEKIVGGFLTKVRSAAKGKDSRIFAFGEMVAVLWAEGNSRAAIQLEHLWNDMAKTHVFSLCCAYPMRGFDREEHGELFLKICEEHSNVIPGEGYTALPDENERLRNISYLQHQAQALATEKAERVQAEEDLRRREAELAELLENAPEGVQQTGPDQKILWANQAALKLLGYTAEEYVGRQFSEFYVHRRTFDEFWARLMRGEEVRDFSAELRCKDGSARHVVITSNGRWEDGKFVHSRSFLRDVTERHAMLNELRLAHEELELRVQQRTAEIAAKNLQIRVQAKTLETANRDLRELSARLLRVQDDERRRIARDLHDSTGQILALLSMTLSGLQAEAKKFSPDLAAGLEQNVEIVRQVSTELRTLSYLLHPPLLDELGLESALRWYVDGFGKRSGIAVTLDLPVKLGRLSRELETAIYRIVQECLTNIHRHSESPTAAIRLCQLPDQIALEVKDEGKGIAQEQLSKIASTGLSGVGLRGIRERVTDFRGGLEITSRESGTLIKVVIPLDETVQGLRSVDALTN